MHFEIHYRGAQGVGLKGWSAWMLATVQLSRPGPFDHCFLHLKGEEGWGGMIHP